MSSMRTVQYSRRLSGHVTVGTSSNILGLRVPSLERHIIQIHKAD